MENETSPVSDGGLLVTSDLIFSTKITGTAQMLGLKIQVIGSPRSVVERFRSESPRGVFLDLNAAGLTAELIREIVGAAAGIPVVAFGSHVDTTRLQAARDAGCTAVMPRSRLSAELPALLTYYLSPTKAE